MNNHDELESKNSGSSVSCVSVCPRKRTAKTKHLSVEDEDTGSELSVPCCERVSSRTSSLLLTEQNWHWDEDEKKMKITREEFSGVLNQISVWVEEAVKEEFVPALEWCMEQNLLLSELNSTPSSPLGEECGESGPSPSERTSQSQEAVSCSASAGSPTSLFFMATSPFCEKPLQTKAGQPLMELQSELKFTSMVRCCDLSTAHHRELLKTLFGITEDKIFHSVLEEVSGCLQNILLPGMTVSMCRTFKLTYTLVDESLMKINSALNEALNSTNAHRASSMIASTSKDVAQSLLYATLTRIQDFFLLCLVSHWQSATQGSSFDIHDELEVMLPLATAKVVTAIFERMLNVCSEGSSEDSEECGARTSFLNFVQAVHDKITSDLFKGASLTEFQYLPASETLPQEDFLQQSSQLTGTNIDGRRPGSPTDSSGQSSQMSWSPKPKTTPADEISWSQSDDGCESLRSFATSRWHMESSKSGSASSVSSAAAFELRSFTDDLPSDTTLYMKQVQMVSEKVLNSTQATLRSAFLRSLLMRVDKTIDCHDGVALRYDILSGSKNVVKSLIGKIAAIVSLSEVSDTVRTKTQQFLQSLEEELEILFVSMLSLTCPVNLNDHTVHESADQLLSNGARQQRESSDSRLDERTKPRRSFPFKLPTLQSLKLKFKKRKNKVEPMCDVSSDSTKKETDLSMFQVASSSCPPSEEPAKSLATKTSTAIPVPKRKSLFSRVATACSKIFRRGSKTSTK